MPVTVCDICKRQINLTKDTLKDMTIFLEDSQDSVFTHEAVMTALTCPACGKTYPVIVDDETTLPILGMLRAVVLKANKYKAKGKKVPEKLGLKQEALCKKLDFKRHKLAEKYNGSFYQVGDHKEQLDYRYHVR